MATHPIGGPNGPSLPDTLKHASTERSRSSEAARELGSARADAEGTSQVDGSNSEKVQISQKARDLLQMSELMNTARNKLDSEPSIRADRVAEVKERLKAGVYETNAIREELAHRLSSILGDLPQAEPGSDSTD